VAAPSDDFGWPILSADCAERVGWAVLLFLICPISPRTESFETAAKNSGHLHRNRSSDQLFPRTPPGNLTPNLPAPGRKSGFIDDFGARYYPSFTLQLSLSPAFPAATHDPLPTFAPPLFSWSYELLFPQPPYFQKHLRCPRGVGMSFPNSASSAPARRKRELCGEKPLTPLLTHCCKFLVVAKKLNSFAIKQLHTLSTKHPGCISTTSSRSSGRRVPPLSCFPSHIIAQIGAESVLAFAIAKRLSIRHRTEPTRKVQQHA
jgi:hypothetical protein